MAAQKIPLTGEVRISSEHVYTMVDALSALKEIGFAYGLYSRAEELRSQRVCLDEHDGHSALVVQEDFSHHGSPCWETVDTITDDPVRIQRYMAFQEVLVAIQQIDRERENSADRQMSIPPSDRSLRRDRNSHAR